MLINCPDCNAEVSDNADKCIKCGCPIRLDQTKTFKNRFKEDFHRNVMEANRTEAARIVAKKVNFLRSWILAFVVFVIGYMILWVSTPNFPEQRVPNELSGYVVIWLGIALLARWIFIYRKTRAYEKLSADEFKKIWLDLGGFSEANSPVPIAQNEKAQSDT